MWVLPLVGLAVVTQSCSSEGDEPLSTMQGGEGLTASQMEELRAYAESKGVGVSFTEESVRTSSYQETKSFIDALANVEFTTSTASTPRLRSSSETGSDKVVGDANSGYYKAPEREFTMSTNVPPYFSITLQLGINAYWDKKERAYMKLFFMNLPKGIVGNIDDQLYVTYGWGDQRVWIIEQFKIYIIKNEVVYSIVTEAHFNYEATKNNGIPSLSLGAITKVAINGVYPR